ncbi:hypothetical protein GE061_013503 [Apolygus lucorum]|uniref:Uncharacterized protein n=1 Tax=Apolygus lucorum TaxID=248454 RepID=A0A8S9XP69_APOLU|nr:hypothetical protein GE061_013503 [Apolygus lucorum]
MGHPTLLTMVLRMVGKMDSLHLAMPDISGSDKKPNQSGSSYTYQADFSCENGTMDAGQFALVDGPYMTGDGNEAQLNFTVSVGSSSVVYSSCQEVTQYPVNHTNHIYSYTSNMLVGGGLKAMCTVGIKRDGISCTTEPLIQIQNVTAVMTTWWNDCPGCKTVILNNIVKALQESLTTVVENIVSGSDLCFLLDY